MFRCTFPANEKPLQSVYARAHGIYFEAQNTARLFDMIDEFEAIRHLTPASYIVQPVERSAANDR